MSLYTNDRYYGGEFKTQVAREIKASSDVIIASGYVSVDVLRSFSPEILRLVKNRGTFNLIVGMGFFDGFSSRTYTSLLHLHESIQSIRPLDSGIRLTWKRRFHGKVYYFRTDNKESLYVGSSNFSSTGLMSNLESTVLLEDQSTATKTKEFITWLNSDSESAYIDRVDELALTDSRPFRDTVVNAMLGANEARRYDLSTISLHSLPYFDISLERINKQSKSNLNSYFGRGRWSRVSGVVVPRNWFEVEVIVDLNTTRNTLYPRGDFNVITDDGFEFECRTQGDNYKNLRSKYDLKILGKWIKQKLQNSGALEPLTPVTLDTLDAYGTHYIRMYQISPNVYYMEFKPDDERYTP